MSLYLNSSNLSFKKVVNSGFVDKSDLLSFLNAKLNSENGFICVSRPRRFGKSLFLSSLEAFLSPNYQNPEDLSSHLELFKDTAVLKETEFCQEFMGKYPTVLISFKLDIVS